MKKKLIICSIIGALMLGAWLVLRRVTFKFSLAFGLFLGKFSDHDLIILGALFGVIIVIAVLLYKRR